MIIWWHPYQVMTPLLGSGIFWRGGSGSGPSPSGRNNEVFYIGGHPHFGGHRSISVVG